MDFIKEIVGDLVSRAAILVVWWRQSQTSMDGSVSEGENVGPSLGNTFKKFNRKGRQK